MEPRMNGGEMEFFMPMKPPTATAQEKGVRVQGGRPVFYETERLKAARTLLLNALGEHAPKEPAKGALELLVKWCFYKRPPVLPEGGETRWHEWKLTPPDTDNLDKLLKDCMTKAGFWRDDAQVCREIIEKHWAAVPGIYVRVTPLED